MIEWEIVRHTLEAVMHIRTNHCKESYLSLVPMQAYPDSDLH